MAVSSTASGTVWIDKHSGYSLKKGLRALYDEVTFHCDRVAEGEKRLRIDFRVSVTLDGSAAVKFFELWRDQIKNHCPDAYIDMEVVIRVLG